MPVSMNNTQVVFNDATTQTTAGYPSTNPNGYTSNTGTVTSVATGNGLSGGTITTTGTLVIAAPTAGSVGSYSGVIFSGKNSVSSLVTFGNNYSAGTGSLQLANASWVYYGVCNVNWTNNGTNALSGTWKYLGCTIQDGNGPQIGGIAVRVS